MKQRVIVFGATGVVGAHLSVSLSANYNVVAVGRRKNDNGFFGDYGIKYHSVDIRNQEDFNILPDKDVDAIVHLAGIMPAAMSGYNPQEYVDSVVKGTMNVLEYAKKIKCEKIIFSHSHADSGYLSGKTPIPSDIEKKFPLTGDHSIYAICKNAAVDIIEHYFYQHGIKRFILRLPTIYAYSPNPYYYVNGVKRKIGYVELIEKAIKGETITVWGDASKKKEIVCINDLIQLIDKCITTNIDGGMYNVGSNRPYSLDEQIKAIVEVFSNNANKSKIVYNPNMYNNKEFTHDISKARNELGYAPKYDLISLYKLYKEHMDKNLFQKLWGTRSDYELQQNN